MQAAWKVWIQHEGEKIFGQGPRDLLLKIESLGSINSAAKAMGMSYSKAIKLIASTEKAMGITLLERSIGGTEGGGSKLTSEARDLVDRYNRYEEASREAVEAIYQSIF
jgi:molybdate transport repressor ModE-like protein